jgi:hypothetical protein
VDEPAAIEDMQMLRAGITLIGHVQIARFHPRR